MDLMEEMWISRPQGRMTKLSDLSDGGVIARIKFYNANKEYTVDSFKLIRDFIIEGLISKGNNHKSDK